MFNKDKDSNRPSITVNEVINLVVLLTVLVLVITGIHRMNQVISEVQEKTDSLESSINEKLAKIDSTRLTSGVTYELNSIVTEELGNADIPDDAMKENVARELVAESKPVETENTSSTVPAEEVIIEPVVETETDEREVDLMVASDVLNIRKEPSTESDVLMKLNIGTHVNVTGLTTVYIDGEEQDTKWYRIETSKGTGYCSSEYLTDSDVKVYLGDFLITHYCDCVICCDVNTGITASGAKTTEGVTVAADTFLAFGTEVEIDGHIYKVQDRGGAVKGNHIDIYVKGHSNALAAGTQRMPVYKVIRF